MPYGNQLQTPYQGQPVTYVLSLEEYDRYGVQAVPANIIAIHSATAVDLQTTFTTQGQNPGQTVSLTPLNVTYDSGGFAKRVWYVALGAPVPGGSPW